MLRKIVDISVYRKVILKDGTVVILKRMTQNDYKKDKNYEYVHQWLNQINKFLSYEFQKVDMEQDKQLFLNSLNNAENIILGALYDEKIIAQLKLNVNVLSPREKHVGIWSIMIHPDFQNKGLATHLLTCIEIIAKKIGLKRLEAEYVEGNIQAEALYIQKLGYIIEGRKKMAFKLDDDTFNDKILIGKIL
ncbi:MAG: GNAT family N-acetyltransferase [Promethearchaeota archaeon]|nr:MAG: GNAT family N-acetyltransferase [Candidatus Lokiarchaeota archaeon]